MVSVSKESKALCITVFISSLVNKLICIYHILILVTGFGATFYCVNGETQTISGQSKGTILSLEEGELFYGDNIKCSWRIDAGQGMRIKLTVVNMDLQWSAEYATCFDYDQLEVWEGTSSCHLNSQNLFNDLLLTLPKTRQQKNTQLLFRQSINIPSTFCTIYFLQGYSYYH